MNDKQPGYLSVNRPYPSLTSDLVSTIDPDIGQVLAKEYSRQKETLELIASENVASPAVMAVQGSVLTNKYAEGYPDKRY